MSLPNNIPLTLKLIRNFTKFAYRYPLLSNIAELIRKLYTPHLKSIIVDDFDHDLNFICDLDRYIGSQMFWMGKYSYHQLNFLDNILQSDMVFLDIGANQGEFTVFAAKRLTQGLVIAFEPVTHLYNRLKNNVEINNFSNVKLIQKGLSNQLGKIPIYSSKIAKEYGLENEGIPSLYTKDDSTYLIEEIELTTLDYFFSQFDQVSRIDIIKMDIEGSELFALQGAINTLQKFRPICIIEINQKTITAAGYTPKNLLEFMENLGYNYKLIFRHDSLVKGGETQAITWEELSEIDDLVFYPN